MKRLMILLLSAGYIACAPCLGHAAEETSPAAEPHSILHKVAMYIPNRVLDTLVAGLFFIDLRADDL